MENNNGRGIFYGVIGVATLVVAIIGATFAYFSASVTKNNIKNIASTSLELEIIKEKSNFKSDLIPVETDGSNGALFGRYIGLDENADSTDRMACKDDVGNSICSVYQFTIKNPSPTTAQTVVGSMKVLTNDFENLYYAVFKGADEDIVTSSYNNINAEASTNTITGGTAGQGGAFGANQVQSGVGTMVVKKTKLLKSSEHTTGTDGAGKNGIYNWPTTLETLSNTASPTTNVPNETTYTIVVWLEETGSNQTSADAGGKTFAAGITFTSDTGKGGVTGIISAGAQS